MVPSSKVTNSDDLAACVLPCCWRTEADILAGFEKEKWELEVCEFHETKDPVREALESESISLREYSKSVVDAFKAVNHQTCIGSLMKTMTKSKAEELLSEAYADSMSTIAEDPDQFNLDVSFWYVMAKKL